MLWLQIKKIFFFQCIWKTNKQTNKKSISCSLFTGERTEWKHRCFDFQISCSSLHAKTLILSYFVMLWTQASRVIQTVKRPSSLTHSISDSLTDSLTHSQLMQHHHSLPRCLSTLFSLFFFASLFVVIFEDICGTPLRCARRHGIEGGVDSADLARIVARWSVLLMSDWARHSAGVKREKHTTQYPMFPIPSVSCAACLWVMSWLWAYLCVTHTSFFAWTEDVVGGF